MHSQPNNPLHGITLKTILTTLVERYGRAGLAEQLPDVPKNIDMVISMKTKQ